MRVKRKSTLLGNQGVKVHPSESSARDRGRSDHNRCSHVRRAEELTPIPGEAGKGGGFGTNIPGASFPIWSTIGL